MAAILYQIISTFVQNIMFDASTCFFRLKCLSRVTTLRQLCSLSHRVHAAEIHTEEWIFRLFHVTQFSLIDI